jgi:hypothetical protein
MRRFDFSHPLADHHHVHIRELVGQSTDRVLTASTQFDRHPRFDRSFVLVADHQTRLERLAKRRPQNLGPEDLLVRDKPELFYAMERQLVDYATRHFGAVVVDTSGELDVSWLENIFQHMPELRGART